MNECALQLLEAHMVEFPPIHLLTWTLTWTDEFAGPHRGEGHRPQALEMCWDGDWAHGVYGFILVRREDVKM